jgi:prevent-host-death family protein
VGIAELKAKLASFLRRVKSGQNIEILERGIPVAIITPLHNKPELDIVPPRKEPNLLSKYRFSVHPQQKFDALEILVEERRKR